MCGGVINMIEGYLETKSRYIRLYRQMFPKRPIELMYCTTCYQKLYDGLQCEKQSQLEHLNVEMDMTQTTHKSE